MEDHKHSTEQEEARGARTESTLEVLRTRAAVALLLVSAILRALYSSWAVLPYKDGAGYDGLAHGLLESSTYGSPEAWAPKSPGYPYFLAAVYGIFGEHHSVLYAVQHALDLVTAVLVLAIALEWGLSRRRALVAFAGALFNPFTFVFASLVLSESLSIFFVTLALWQLIRLRDYSLPRLAYFGATMSAAALIRPAFAAVAPALLVAFWLVRRGPFTMWFKGAAVAGFAFLLVWAPWGMRNVSRFHRIVPYHVGSEQPHPGYSAWCYTWVSHMLDVYGAFWEKPTVLPAHAFSSDAERIEVESLLRRREDLGPDADPDGPPVEAIETRFAELAMERKAREPLTFWLVLPAKRAVTLWLTRETTILGQANVKMSDLRGAIRTRPLALGAKLSLFVLMPILPILMLIGSASLFRAGRRSVLLPLAGGITITVIIEYLMLFQPAFLVVMEPRYVIEFFPALTPAAVVGAFALLAFGRRGWDRARQRSKVGADGVNLVRPDLDAGDAADSQR